IDKAAAYIAKAFKKAGLETPPSSTNFFQEFTLIEAKQTNASGTINGSSADSSRVIAFTSKESLQISQDSGYENVKINAGDRLFNTAYGFIRSGKNYVVWVDTAHAKNFLNLLRLKRES